MATIDVKDAAGATVALEKPLAPARAAAAASRPVVLSNEDFAVLDGLETAIASTNTKLDTLAGVAHDAVDSGNPTKIGARAKSGLSSITLVAADDRSDLFTGLDGTLYVRQVPLPDIVAGNASNTDGASTAVIATAGAGIKQYLTAVTLTNMHASTVVYVELKSGTTVRWTCPVPPGGYTFNFNPPLPPNAADEAWNFDPSAAVTTIICSMLGFKSKV